jgi:hypothetical protein
LIQGDLIVSKGCTGWDGTVLLFQQPSVDYGAPDQRTPTSANVGNGGNPRNFAGENVGQVRARDAEVMGRSPDIQDLAVIQCGSCSAHDNTSRAKPSRTLPVGDGTWATNFESRMPNVYPGQKIFSNEAGMDQFRPMETGQCWRALIVAI